MSRSIIVMGVSASGKSSVGLALAKALNVKFIDGDDLHPKSNIIKMASGQPLDDNDRSPWLTRINDVIYSLECKNETAVLVCSALKKQYRDQIVDGNKKVTFIFLDGSKELILQRIQQRTGHFMKATMLNSQFESLERPDDEANTIILSIEHSIDEIVAQALSQLTHINEDCK